MQDQTHQRPRDEERDNPGQQTGGTGGTGAAPKQDGKHSGPAGTDTEGPGAAPEGGTR